MWNSLGDWLGRPENVKLEVLMMLFLVRVYTVTREHFIKSYESLRRQSAGSSKSKFDKMDLSLAELERASSRVSQRSFLSEGNVWNWGGFPSLWWILTLVQNFTTLYMTYVILKNTYPQYFMSLIELLEPELPAHCYLLGRFIIHDLVSELTATLFSLFHILWRLYLRMKNRPYSLHVVNFLLQSDTDIQRFISIIEQSGEDKRQESKKWSRVSVHEHFLRQNICYQVFKRSTVVFKVRPNRTLSSRRAICKRVARLTLLLSTTLLSLAVIIIFLIMITILTEKHYIQTYPKCDAGIQKRMDEGTLGDWSMSLYGHHLISGLIDGLENAVIWIDSGLAFCFVWGFLYVLNFDLLLYWEHMHAKLIKLLARIRLEYTLRSYSALGETFGPVGRSAEPRPSGKKLGLEVFEQIEAQYKLESQLCIGMEETHWDQSYMYSAGDSRSSLIDLRGHGLEDEIQDAQSMIGDFFHQIKAADMLVSDVLTGFIIIWLTTFASFGRYSATVYAGGRESELLLIMFLVQMLTFCLVASSSFSLLVLQRRCIRSYHVICSIAAFDQSRMKRSFLRILDFYTVQRRLYYTLFQQYPYTGTTFLSIIGWSVSCFLIFDSLFRHR